MSYQLDTATVLRYKQHQRRLYDVKGGGGGGRSAEEYVAGGGTTDRRFPPTAPPIIGSIGTINNYFSVMGQEISV